MVLHSSSQSPRVLNSATGVTNKIQNQSIKQQKFTKGPLWQTIEYTELHTLHRPVLKGLLSSSQVVFHVGVSVLDLRNVVKKCAIGRTDISV